MSSEGPQSSRRERSITELMGALDSLVESERAAEQLIRFGARAIPYLEHFLLNSPPRSISLPRCHAVHVLGELGAFPVLLAYFRQYTRPADASVLFAEDAVRSAAASELLHFKSEAVFSALLAAARQRATSGLVQAVGEFRSAAGVPLLFDLLEDDLCREDAKEALRKIPDAAQPYAILLLRKRTELPVEGPCAARRRRATLQLLCEFGITAREWPEQNIYLWDEDPDCVIATARLGFRVAREEEQETIAAALIEASARMNGAQEMEAVELLDACPGAAHNAAMRIAAHRKNSGEKPNWMSPFWRVLFHALGRDFKLGRRDGA